MTAALENVEHTLLQLKKSSQASLTMVIFGALALIGSLVISGTTLVDLQAKVSQKSAELAKLSAQESDLQQRITQAQTEFNQLKTNIEQLYAVRVTSDNLVFELKATAKATGQMTSQGPGYDFSIFINATPETLQQISKVKYEFLHATFNQKVRTAIQPETQFLTTYYGWGCLSRVSATLYLRSGETKSLDFNMCQSLGPQWWNEQDIADAEPTKQAPVSRKLPVKKRAGNQ